MIILEKIVLWLRLWSYQMIILCCGCSCGLFLEKNWVVVGVVVSYCTKIGLMLLLGCVIQSNCGCGCGCGCSLQVDCVVVVVVVDHFSFCTSLVKSLSPETQSQRDTVCRKPEPEEWHSLQELQEILV